MWEKKDSLLSTRELKFFKIFYHNFHFSEFLKFLCFNLDILRPGVTLQSKLLMSDLNVVLFHSIEIFHVILGNFVIKSWGRIENKHSFTFHTICLKSSPSKIQRPPNKVYWKSLPKNSSKDMKESSQSPLKDSVLFEKV